MTSEQINQLSNQYHLPAHIRRHCQKVAEVARVLGKKLSEKGHIIDLKSLEAACLLHDLVRVIDMKNFDPITFEPKPTLEDINVWNQLRDDYQPRRHEDVAAEILQNLNQPVIANLIYRHHFWLIIDNNEKPVTWEEKLIYYADKRVAHDKIVDLDFRLEEGFKRNSGHEGSPDQLAKYQKACQAIKDLEKEIFAMIGERPDFLRLVISNRE